MHLCVIRWCEMSNKQQWMDVGPNKYRTRTQTRVPPIATTLHLGSETLGQAIRKDTRIQGIHYPGGKAKTSKLVQYADDTTLTLQDEESVLKSFEIIHRFESGSGSKLNINKTEGTYVGQHAGKTQGPVPIKWNKSNITVLGTKIGQDLTQDWETKMKKMEKRLEI